VQDRFDPAGIADARCSILYLRGIYRPGMPVNFDINRRNKHRP